jgi:hypothetical protein
LDRSLWSRVLTPWAGSSTSAGRPGDDDPQRTPPAIERLVSARTASEAADLAREIALEHPRHGFHKPSGAWWGADQQYFHRVVVHAGRRRSMARPLGVAILGVAALALIGLSRRPPR